MQWLDLQRCGIHSTLRVRRGSPEDKHSTDEIILQAVLDRLKGMNDATMRALEEGDPSCESEDEGPHARASQAFYSSLLGGLHSIVQAALLIAIAEVSPDFIFFTAEARPGIQIRNTRL